MEEDAFAVYRSVSTARAEYRGAAAKILYEVEGEGSRAIAAVGRNELLNQKLFVHGRRSLGFC